MADDKTQDKKRLVDGVAKKVSWVVKNKLSHLPPKELRHLPSELVTHEDEDPEKVHRLDPPHIVKALTYEYAEKQADKPQENDLPSLIQFPKPGTAAPLNQRWIDWIAAHALLNILNNAKDDIAEGKKPDLRVRHLYFPENNINHHELRIGPPPKKRRLPRHMHHFSVIIDPLGITSDRLQKLLDSPDKWMER